MTFTLTWHAVAERDLLDLPHWRTAARVAAAMMQFAQAGVGTVERTERPDLHRLRGEHPIGRRRLSLDGRLQSTLKKKTNKQQPRAVTFGPHPDDAKALREAYARSEHDERMPEGKAYELLDELLGEPFPRPTK